MSNLRFVLLCVAVFSVARPAAAATYVMMTDDALADGAPIIAEVVVEAAASPLSPAAALTDYQVRIERLLKGIVPGNTVVLRLAGGQRADGMRLHLPGMPVFREGERALVFLVPRPDGTYGLYQLMLGAFHGVERGGETLAVRALASSQALDLAGHPVPSGDRARDFGRFADWLAARGAGSRAAVDYFVELPAGELEALSAPFTLFEDPGTGLNFRWPDFGATAIDFFAHEDGQPGVAGGGFAQFQDALEAWNDDPSTVINYDYAGTTTADFGLFCPFPDPTEGCFDDINAILFDDPNDLHFGGPFNCVGGGVLAIGGPWFSSSTTHSYKGMTFITIQGADIATNKNTGCFLGANDAAREVFGHELGHTLGLGHSCGDSGSGACNTTAKNQALMRASAHGDGRGAQLGDDDRAAIAFLYSPEGTCAAGPQTLCLNNDRFRVVAEYETVGGDSGFGTGVDLTPDTGYFWFFNPANVEMVVKVLDACGPPFDRFWVFAGGLTNVEVELTVTDTETGDIQTYTNPQTTPFQPIQDTNAFATCP